MVIQWARSLRKQANVSDLKKFHHNKAVSLKKRKSTKGIVKRGYKAFLSNIHLYRRFCERRIRGILYKQERKVCGAVHVYRGDEWRTRKIAATQPKVLLSVARPSLSPLRIASDFPLHFQRAQARASICLRACSCRSSQLDRRSWMLAWRTCSIHAEYTDFPHVPEKSISHR